MMKFEIQRTSRFKKDYKLAVKMGCNISKLREVITLLANGETLSRKYIDHELSGKYSNYRECHIEPDWLLIYEIDESMRILSLCRTGSHSDLF